MQAEAKPFVHSSLINQSISLISGSTAHRTFSSPFSQSINVLFLSEITKILTCVLKIIQKSRKNTGPISDKKVGWLELNSTGLSICSYFNFKLPSGLIPAIFSDAFRG